MADINDVLQGLNLPATSQEAPPSNLHDSINNAVQQGILQSPLSNLRDITNQVQYGLPSGQEPTQKQKIGKFLEDLARGVLIPGYRTPTERTMKSAENMYQGQTQRLGEGAAMERLWQQLGLQTQKNQILQQNADTMSHRVDVMEAENKARDDARIVRNNLTKLEDESKAGLRSKQALLDDYRAQYEQYKVQHPGLTDDQIMKELTDGNTTSERAQNLITARAAMGAAKNPLAAVGSTSSNTSTTDPVTGITTSNRTQNRNFAFPGLIGNLLGVPSNNGSSFIQNLLRGVTGGIISPGARQANPAVPPQANSAAPAAPTTPTIPGLNPVSETPDYTNSRVPIPSGTQVGGQVATKRIADREARTDAIRQIGSYGMNARSLGQTLMDAIGKGTAQDYTGLVQGSPLMQDIRSSLGEVKPEETLLRGGLFESLYGKLKASMKGRYNLPEISAAGRMVGGQTQKAENALMAATMLSLQSDAQRLYENGQIDQNNAPLVSRAILSEMQRIQGLIKDKGAYAAAHDGGADKIRTLEDVLSDVGQKQVPIYKGGKQAGTVRQDQLTKALSQGYSPRP